MRKLGNLGFLAFLFLICLPAASVKAAAQEQPGVQGRPPAVPLIVHDPYFSIWSASDRLTDDWTRHWTGRVHPISGLVRVDGKAFRFAGPSPSSVPAMEQKSMFMTPTRTVYTFSAAGVELSVTFLSPLLIHDLDVMSRPLTYIVAEAVSADGLEHDVSLYFSAGAEIAVNTPDQSVFWGRYRVPGLEVMAVGSQEQRLLGKNGDDLRIDWGWLYLAVPQAQAAASHLGSGWETRRAFAETGVLPEADLTERPRPADDGIAAAAVLDFGRVAGGSVSRRLMLAYDDGFSIEYFYRKLRPYWRRIGWTADDLLSAADREYESVLKRCLEFDRELVADLKQVGGEKYAFSAVLAYRQSIAAHKLAVDLDGTPLFFPKENFSNGCISTVDVIYPAAPQYLLFNPVLARGLLIPVMEYAKSPLWPFPFAPHDLGTYPWANGQVYGGGALSEEDQMPVEESGNMIILAAALAQAEGNPAFAERYWPLLSRWAAYLREKGLDPENQLCTDDFAGHLAHNANLSLKAILGLRSYAWLAERTGRRKEAAEYGEIAKRYAREWVKMSDDGDHFRLAFDRPGTWSQKYNLVWDRVLGFNLFPPAVAKKELEFYARQQLKYGLPLDSRKTYTKLDWVFWTAALAGDRETFLRFIEPVHDFLNETPDRVPMTDWYWTDTGRKTGFQARPVVGGVFIPMLADPAMRAKWRLRPAAGAEQAGDKGATRVPARAR